jgi:aspartate dehydrogenase
MSSWVPAPSSQHLPNAPAALAREHSEPIRTKAVRVGLIGGGAIASAVAAYAAAQGSFDIAAVLVRSPKRAQKSWSPELTVSDPAALIERRPDVVVECASHDAVRLFVPAILSAGIDVIVASVGCLAAPEVIADLSAVLGPARLTLPAGAILGIDGLSAAARGGLDSVTLRSTKPPQAWVGTAAEDAVDLQALTALTVFFEGTARVAAHRYPKNANVAAIVALAGIGFDRTRVQLAADPTNASNTHRLEASGAFGRFVVEVEGTPSIVNPRTSQLAALSLIRAIETKTQRVVL